MDEQEQKNQYEHKELTDAEVLAAVMRRIGKVIKHFELKNIPLVWKIIFYCLILVNVLMIITGISVLSFLVFPNIIGFYFFILFEYILQIAIVIFAVTIGMLIIFLVTQKPKGRMFDYIIRAIYIVVIIYTFPLVLFVMRLIYN